MICKNASLVRFSIVFTLLPTILLMYFYLRNPHPIIFHLNQRVTNNGSIKDYKTSYTKLNFVIDKAYWNFTLNSFLQMKLERDISPDINFFIQNNAKFLGKAYDPQIPIYEQTKYYRSMSAVGGNINISTNESLTFIFSRICYSKTICHEASNSDRSYIYVEVLTSKSHKAFYNLNSKNEKMIKIPGVLNITISEPNECCLGLEDPRIVLYENNHLFLIFNMLDIDKRRKIWLYDILTDYQASFSVQNNPSPTVEKNWSPFVKDKKLYLIYSYNPFKILQCTTKKDTCAFISSTQSSDHIGSFQGGTQLVRYRDSDYYVGIARTTISCDECQRFCRPHLIVLSTNSGKFHLVYISEPLMLDEIPMFASYFILHKKKSADFCENIIRIMTPGSIIDWRWPEDKLTFTITINHMKSYIVSIVGIGHVVQNMISAIETEYSQVFYNDKLNLKMVSYSEAMALSYCKSASNTNKLIFEKFKARDQYPKEKIIKDVIDSPTYPTFRVASNTESESLKSWIRSDYVNFGLMSRYLTEYESAHGYQPVGTHLMVDAGGNHATYALYSAALNQSVFVFEILPDYWTVIQESIRINLKFNERIILYPFGVSDEHRIWKILPGEGMTRLDFIKSGTSKTENQTSSNDLTIAQAYPMDDFIFQKVSLMKIDVEGFEIRALRGIIQIIRNWGIGAILIEIAAKRWSWNNITLDEGIFVLEQVTSLGNYLFYVIARNDAGCPISEISKLHGVIEIKNLSMINMQNGKYEVAPQIFRLAEWTTMMMHMKDNDWSCNFWFESDIRRSMI